MALAVRRDDEKKAQRAAWAKLFGGVSDIYAGANSGRASGSLVTTAVIGSGGVAEAWESAVKGSLVVYTGYVPENTGTLGLTSGSVVLAAGGTSAKSDYSVETLALLDQLIATPLDKEAPVGEQEFLDWLNGK